MLARGKILIVTILAISMFLSLTGLAFAQPSDIKGHWAEKQINDWVNKDLAKGYPGGTFKPDNSITRAEFITLVNRAFGFTEKAQVSFSDVSSKDWFYVK